MIAIWKLRQDISCGIPLSQVPLVNRNLKMLKVSARGKLHQSLQSEKLDSIKKSHCLLVYRQDAFKSFVDARPT